MFVLCIAAAAAKSLQSCPTLCDPIDGSPPGSPIPGILLPFPSPMHESEKRQTLTDIKGETDRNTIIVGDFNAPFTPMDTASKQKMNKETHSDPKTHID